MKTRDLILMELAKTDRISLKDLSEMIDKKIDTTSHQVKNLVNEGVVRSERVRLGRSFITYVWLSKNNIQLEKDKIQVDKILRSPDLSSPEKTLDINKFVDPPQKRFQVESKKTDRILEKSNIQVEKLNLSTDMLRSYYWILTVDPRTLKGKSHRGNRNNLIDEIHKELDNQRGV